MVIFCQHGFAVGFQLIGKAEGCRDLFAALCTYWEAPPKIVVYYYACGLHQYCMSRRPELFADTLFLVDEFHWTNHTCEPKYRVRTHARTIPLLKNLKTNVPERENNPMDRISKSVSYMGHLRAFLLTRHFLALRNEETITAMGRL